MKRGSLISLLVFEQTVKFELWNEMEILFPQETFDNELNYASLAVPKKIS
jgi:hypothetical protein